VLSACQGKRVRRAGDDGSLSNPVKQGHASTVLAQACRDRQTATYERYMSRRPRAPRQTEVYPLERVREKPKSVTHQPNQSLNLDGDRDVPEGLFGKKNLSFETLFRSRPHQPKKKRAFCSFFFFET
jgi:hypothetical protein